MEFVVTKKAGDSIQWLERSKYDENGDSVSFWTSDQSKAIRSKNVQFLINQVSPTNFVENIISVEPVSDNPVEDQCSRLRDFAQRLRSLEGQINCTFASNVALELEMAARTIQEQIIGRSSS